MTRTRALKLFAAAAVCLSAFAQVSIRGVARSPPVRDHPRISPAQCASILFSMRRMGHAYRAAASRFNPARGPHGTHTLLGQILIVTSGTGWVQEWGGPKLEIREGDVVRIPPGRKHWHGATATTTMTHIAIQEQLD